MAAAAQHGSVWVGFMDIVPVIGTVKEGVEWAVALYEENKEVVKEKEKAINELLLVPALPLKPQALAEPESLVEPMKVSHIYISIYLFSQFLCGIQSELSSPV